MERSRVAFALEGLENIVLLFSIGPLQNNYLYFLFYMLFHSLCKMIRSLPLEKADLCFPTWERNLPKCSMSKLNNISNFYLPWQSTDSWSGSQSQKFICTSVSTAKFCQASFQGPCPRSLSLLPASSKGDFQMEPNAFLFSISNVFKLPA